MTSLCMLWLLSVWPNRSHLWWHIKCSGSSREGLRGRAVSCKSPPTNEEAFSQLLDADFAIRSSLWWSMLYIWSELHAWRSNQYASNEWSISKFFTQFFLWLQPPVLDFVIKWMSKQKVCLVLVNKMCMSANLPGMAGTVLEEWLLSHWCPGKTPVPEFYISGCYLLSLSHKQGWQDKIWSLYLLTHTIFKSNRVK